MCALLQRLQRRAVVVLMWLVLALSVAPAQAAHGRADVLLIGASAQATVAGSLSARASRSAHQAAERHATQRRAVELAAAPSPPPGPFSARVAPVPPRRIALEPRDGRYSYSINCTLLC